jgi:hypothetical protein
MTRWLVPATCAATILLLALDPYSYGRVGGDVTIAMFAWQSIVAWLLALLLLLVAGAALMKRYRLAFGTLLCESLIFVGMNLAYFGRDGVSRFVVGYESSPQTFAVVATGLLLRALLFTILWGGLRRPRGVERAPGGA